jgi:Fe-S cluster assembly ATP-binding protein
MLEVKNLQVKIGDKQILNGLNLTIKSGEVHAIMGPNGSGKSTLSKVVAGHPSYDVISGEILYDINFEMKNLLELETDERAKEGIFMAFQYPVEIPGVNNFTFLQQSFNAICKHQGSAVLDDESFKKLLHQKAEIVEMNPSFLERGVNEGFSGGEKKRNEILQMLVLNPRLSFLDETDSGLDIDSLKIVAKGVNAQRSKNHSIVMVTHYQRLLDYIKPDYVHVLANGKIVKSGDKTLALELEAKGYDWVLEDANG